ncbi:catalase/peroxidase HPI [Saccharopolyspora endophytica]|uniref:Catalase-peroxidase n=1 Tax=Saccharopolyspora endophytica TaxID=543886 RepID=A0ABS5DGG1_9PSEU|nr:catalase/peroxidase HPI [Saccharopolyspora endophytica]MBQ0925375.1 catalase/peroxidase HPI [Saccharopolyspora endophytica]
MPENPDAVAVTRNYDQSVRRRVERARNHPAAGGDNRDWWPGRLDLGILAKHHPAANPLGAGFDYAAEFAKLDLDAVARDVDEVLTTSQDWWPADFGHYGPLVLRMAWHCAGTYRVGDGRGGASTGMQRFAPTNSWPDNRNLDKARRLLWPVKQKYGRSISWADLMVFAGNRALESMGFTTLGFAGGREDVWESEADVYWGPERAWLADERHTGVRDLQEPLAADEMGLIYVDPQGPSTLPDPIAAGRAIRESFRRMGMNDEETVALIVGGHTFGKTHGAADLDHLAAEPEGAGLEEQGLGWRNSYGTGKGPDAISTGLEGIWTPTPTRWDNSFLETLFAYEWDVVLSPAGLWQWVPSEGQGHGTAPDPHDPLKRHTPTMLTTDLALQEDPGYAPIARRFLARPDDLADTFARAWFKLTHIDMGPRHNYLGPLVPAERMIWQDPLPEVDHDLIDDTDITDLKNRIAATGIPIPQLVFTAWASASTYRAGDERGGADGARIRLEPQRRWDANDPGTTGPVLAALEGIQQEFNAEHAGLTRVSLADLIVLAGCAAIERAANGVQVPFTPGRTDAAQEWTDVESFAALEPTADGFRNYVSEKPQLPAEHLLIDRANQLRLSAPEMTALIGGLRALGATHRGTPLGVLTTRPGELTNDFFTHLLDMTVEWAPRSVTRGIATTFAGRDRATGELRWTASRVDLVFGSHSELRALAEFYAAEPEQFSRDFASAWDKVMNLGRPEMR